MTKTTFPSPGFGRLFAGALTLFALAAPGAAARADIPPPDTAACQASHKGAACELEGAAAQQGTCQNATCTRADYENWNRDASASPPTMSYPCLKCTAAADADAGAAPIVAPPADSGAGGTGTGGTGAGGTGAGGTATGGSGAGGSGAGGSGAGGTATGGSGAGAGGTATGGSGAGGTTATGGTPATGGSGATSDDSGCSLAGLGQARSFGPWLLAGSVGALLFVTRRRRR